MRRELSIDNIVKVQLLKAAKADGQALGVPTVTLQEHWPLWAYLATAAAVQTYRGRDFNRAVRTFPRIVLEYMLYYDSGYV